MRSRAIGTTSLEVTELGLGGSRLGNLYAAVSDDEATAAVDAAWEAGVRHFDTAPHYGLGLAEERLGRALAGRPRDSYVLSTKVGRRLVPDPDGAARRDDEGFDVPATFRRVWDFSRDGILRSLETSLERLGTDRVDVVYLHDPDDHFEVAAGEGFATLDGLRSEGVVRAIGVGMNQSRMPARFIRETELDLVMVAGRYTLLEHDALHDLLPTALRHGVSVIAAAVFNTGLLATDRPGAAAKYNYSDAPAVLVARARRIASVCRRHGTTLPAAALQFPLGHAAVASVVIGAKDGAEMRSNGAAFASTVPSALWAELRAEGLVAADIPLPGDP